MDQLVQRRSNSESPARLFAKTFIIMLTKAVKEKLWLKRMVLKEGLIVKIGQIQLSGK